MVCFPLELRRLKHERRVIAAKPLELAALLFGRVWGAGGLRARSAGFSRRRGIVFRLAELDLSRAARRWFWDAFGKFLGASLALFLRSGA